MNTEIKFIWYGPNSGKQPIWTNGVVDSDYWMWKLLYQTSPYSLYILHTHVSGIWAAPLLQSTPDAVSMCDSHWRSLRTSFVLFGTGSSPLNIQEDLRLALRDFLTHQNPVTYWTTVLDITCKCDTPVSPENITYIRVVMQNKNRLKGDIDDSWRT